MAAMIYRVTSRIKLPWVLRDNKMSNFFRKLVDALRHWFLLRKAMKMLSKLPVVNGDFVWNPGYQVRNDEANDFKEAEEFYDVNGKYIGKQIH